MNARTVAVKALIKVSDDGGYSNIVLDHALAQTALPERDRAFASALFYGVLERRITIDYILSRFLKQPIEKLPSLVRETLRIGVLQIKFMDKIPPFAAVNECVNIIRHSKYSKFGGVVNGVLRSVERCTDDLLPTGESAQALSVNCSVSVDIAQRLISDYGFTKAQSILLASFSVPKTYLKINTLKTDKDSVRAKLEKSGISCFDTDFDDMVYIDKNTDSALFDQSDCYHAQDMSSRICCEKVGAGENMRVLDLCAAPGGKSFTVAQIMGGTGEVVSCDLHAHRVELIASGAKRLGLDNVTAVRNDASVFNPSLGRFDRVLCDVPCSGIGIIRRKPDIKYKTEKDFSSLPEIQYDILSAAAGYVKTGGRIIYSTCTLFKSENEEVFNRFLDEHKNFEKTDMLTLFPDNNVTDGFFIASAVKKGE